MRARTLYNIIYTKVSAGALKALAALCVLLIVSCAQTGVIDDIPEIDINGKDPMNFTCLTQNNEQEHTTRAASSLTSDFMVSTYKSYGETRQQTVMDRYVVEYKENRDDWNGIVNSNWNYVNVTNPFTSTPQYEKYWDYSAFPYRFHAVAPYTSNTPSEVTLDDKNLKINKTYQMQICTNGLVSPTDAVAEPYLIAQIQRNTDGTDQDLIGNGSVNNTSTSKNRYVAMPFHHINSKIRFGIYTTTQWLTANKTYIKDLEIKVIGGTTTGTNEGTTTEVLATAAAGYTASGTGSWKSDTGFTGLTTVPVSSSDGLPIFTFAGGKDIPGNDLTNCQTRQTAFFLSCPQGIMQIPQKDVQMQVSFKLYEYGNDTEAYETFTNVPIRIVYENAPDDPKTTFDWTAGNIHTYYLVIGEVQNKLEITFTATLAPWEDVTGSLTTDLEQ